MDFLVFSLPEKNIFKGLMHKIAHLCSIAKTSNTQQHAPKTPDIQRKNNLAQPHC